ncbi:MAG: HD domain-containing protein [Candidatus Omnitrophica bacterium]|nr:HD domain-containing protein [Candidatus Omnitrophota bacterium]
MIKFRINSFQTKLTLILVASMIFMGTLSNFLIYRFAMDKQFNQLRSKLMMLAGTSALMINPDMLMRVPMEYQGAATHAYKEVMDELRRIKKANRSVRFIYTLAKTDQPGVLQFIVDADPYMGAQRNRGMTSYPGNKFDASGFPEALKAFSEPSADERLKIDEWGVTLSGYSPIYDPSGKVIAILGIDVGAKDLYLTRRALQKRALIILLLGVVFSGILGILFSRRLTGPIRKLVEGTRHIAMGDLQYQVRIEGGDEISELARHFNKMANILYRSRRRVHSYFYRVIQSLIQIIEARDPYTGGHSERVADYAVKIAAKMNFTDEQIELLRETALLHDIGKLGIKESVLNKKGKLTDNEWSLIRRHPVIAEDILRPILLNAEMLTVVRGHHERYDGTGYPDKLAGDNINVFAQILAVADAYDALTSSRAYRAAFSKSDAVKELEKNKGTQFNPHIVNLLIEVLEAGEEALGL